MTEPGGRLSRAEIYLCVNAASMNVLNLPRGRVEQWPSN